MTSYTVNIVSNLHAIATANTPYNPLGLARTEIITQAAKRLEELYYDNKCLVKQVEYGVQEVARLNAAVKDAVTRQLEAEAYADKLVQNTNMACLPKDLENLREANGQFAEEIEDLKEECTILAEYVRVLQTENKMFEDKLEEQSENKVMNKFALRLDKLKDEVLFELIAKGSKVATGYDYKTFYTNSEGVPHDWYNTFIDDIRDSVSFMYKGERFNVVYASSTAANYYDHDEQDDVLGSYVSYIFYRDQVFTLDPYFTDCEIFQQVVTN